MINEVINLEQEILGGLINNNTLIDQHKEIKAKFFSLEIHKNIFAAIIDMHSKSLSIDLVSFLNYNKHKVKKMDSVSYITEVASCSPSTRNFKTKVNLLIENYKVREIKSLTNKLIETDNIEELTGMVETTLKTVYETSINKELDIISEYDDYLNWLMAESTDTGSRSGLHKLDKILGNFQKGRLITLFARSGIGKSTVAIQIAANMSMQKQKVVYGSGEMSRVEVFNKIISSKLNIPYSVLMNRLTTDDDKERISIFMAKLTNTGLYITNETNIDKFISEVKLYKMKYGLDVVFVDYVNKYISGMTGMQTTEKIGQVTAALKTLALEDNVCVVLLAQANRKSDDKIGMVNEKVTEGDIQDSARIEQDSDQVIALYRNKKLDNPEFRVAADKEGKLDYNSKDADKNPECINMTVLKNRHGEKGTKAFKWEGAFSRVTNYME